MQYHENNDQIGEITQCMIYIELNDFLISGLGI